jgi:hypothetical protein
MSDEKPRRRSNRPKKRAEKRATQEKIRSAHDDYTPRKTKRMSGFLSVTLLAVAASLPVSLLQHGKRAGIRMSGSLFGGALAHMLCLVSDCSMRITITYSGPRR